MKDRSRGSSARPRAKAASVATPKTRQRAAALGPLSHFIGYALRRAQLVVFDDFFHTFADLDLRPAQFGLLIVISQNPGLKQADASAALGIQTPNFVALVDALERRGIVQRLPTENDRRSYALHLTRAGEALLKRVLVRQAEHEERMTARIGKAGREQLLALLDKLANVD
ncbi:MAG TPA: MarR family transcriptional regulator [Povalibacter sp.]|uniref:MarR family winged helix-turn-helix transcriptional regulator n=1 Tax=Povalibacter sp. TaxID=1962978 RepID=UPI002CB7E5D3|nr:MarR family transcriptional regulator [Povalibacter sp.]HMN44345.1 MarR family transcriptional regulator [Povalibacter sp.]